MENFPYLLAKKRIGLTFQEIQEQIYYIWVKPKRKMCHCCQ